MKRFFSWFLDTEHGLFFSFTGWAHYKNVFKSSSSLKPGSPARQESGGRTLSITESGSATLQVVIAESWTMFSLSRTKGRDDASVWSCCMVWLSRPHNYLGNIVYNYMILYVIIYNYICSIIFNYMYKYKSIYIMSFLSNIEWMNQIILKTSQD